MSEASEGQAAPWMVRETLAKQLVPLLELYDVKWRGHGMIYVDDQHYNIDTAYRIVADLSASLDVPVDQVRARLVELGWLNDVRHSSSTRKEAVRVDDEPASRSTSWEDEYEYDDFGPNDDQGHE